MELLNKLWNIHLMQDHAAKGMSKQVNTQNMGNVAVNSYTLGILWRLNEIIPMKYLLLRLSVSQLTKCTSLCKCILITFLFLLYWNGVLWWFVLCHYFASTWCPSNLLALNKGGLRKGQVTPWPVTMGKLWLSIYSLRLMKGQKKFLRNCSLGSRRMIHPIE